MSGLRARLAEVLAKLAGEEIDKDTGEYLAASLCLDPALARALEDAERVAALEAERDRYLNALLARHGGECIALLDELDGEREKSAALEAENAELRETHAHELLAYQTTVENLEARLAAGVEVEVSLSPEHCVWMLSEYEQSALLPLDGKRVIVVEATDNARDGKE